MVLVLDEVRPHGEETELAQIGVPTMIRSYVVGSFFVSSRTVSFLNFASKPLRMYPMNPCLFLVSMISSMSHWRASAIACAAFLVAPSRE